MTIRKLNSLARLFVLLILSMAASSVRSQSQQATPTPTSTPVESSYEITSSVELGIRGLRVNGNDNKYRSDLNYKNGFRVFDSSFFIENKSSSVRLFDTMLVTTSGWGGDPSGFFRLNMDKSGIYKFDSTVRRVKYFNNLNNHALNEHNADTKHNLGDFDLTIFPEQQKLRFRLGGSFSKSDGSGGYTTRAYSDEFPVTSFVNNRSTDLRAGVEGQLLGFNLSLSHGWRDFEDNTRYFLETPNLGNNPTNNARLNTFQRNYPVDGTSHYTSFNAQRTFAKRVDFIGRFIYSTTGADFSLGEQYTGRDNSNNIVVLDEFNINGNSKRVQGRGDVGVTVRVTDDLRISNTFTYDQFNISGANLFAEMLVSTTAAGVSRPTVLTSTGAYRITGFKRAMNTIEADYQLNNTFAFNIGYRFTDRRIVLEGIDTNLITNVPALFSEEFDNGTNTVIAGVRAKPMKNWNIYADVEHGKADNVFTRLANYKFTNFRIRSRMSFKKFFINLSAITKDNNNPSQTVEAPPRSFTANITNRIYSASVDWTPDSRFSLSAGDTYQHLTSATDIIVPVNNVRTPGVSRYFVRDHSFFFDIFAQPHKRVSFYAHYSISKDNGQGDLVATRLQDIITSYPMEFQTPEARLVIRLSKNIDWNLGYKYYNYNERFPNAQNYNAHLPYTSLRFYFGKAAADR